MTNSNDSWWTVKLTLKGLTVPLKFDNGSDVNILPMSHYKNMKKPKINPTKIRTLAIKYLLRVRQTFTSKEKGSLHELCLIITLRNVKPILARDPCDKLNLIRRVNTVQNLGKTNILSAYGDLFTGIGCLPGRVLIKFTHDTLPVIEAWPKIPFTMFNEVKRKRVRVKQVGVLRKCNSADNENIAYHAQTKWKTKDLCGPTKLE